MIGSLEDIASRYQAILCDVWGVVHNGERAFPAASAPLAPARRHGLAAVLLTNAPRPSPDGVAQLKRLAVRTALGRGRHLRRRDPRPDRGRPAKIHHVGPDRDFSIYDGSISTWSRNSRLRGRLHRLFDDETEVPKTMPPRCAVSARDLPFICANPTRRRTGRPPDLVRRRAGARLCAARRPHLHRRQAAPADLRGVAQGSRPGARPRARRYGRAGHR